MGAQDDVPRAVQALIARIAADGETVYGVNTGPGLRRGTRGTDSLRAGPAA